MTFSLIKSNLIDVFGYNNSMRYIKWFYKEAKPIVLMASAAGLFFGGLLYLSYLKTQ